MVSYNRFAARSRFGAVYHSEDAEESRIRETYVREALNIPPNRRIVAILGLGFPVEKPQAKKMLERNDIVFYESFKHIGSKIPVLNFVVRDGYFLR